MAKTKGDAKSGKGAEHGGALARSPSHLLHRVLQLALDIYAEESGSGGITQRQFAVLAAVAENQGVTQTGLVRATGIDRSTLAIGNVMIRQGITTIIVGQDGSSRANGSAGEGSFEVEGLVLNGGAGSGTIGAVTSVVGTLVCNPGGTGGSPEAAIDTPAANLSAAGDAELSFKINVPAACNKPLFLIRAPNGRWIATGTKPATGSKFHY